MFFCRLDPQKLGLALPLQSENIGNKFPDELIELHVPVHMNIYGKYNVL
jgi:hypothetical protein